MANNEWEIRAASMNAEEGKLVGYAAVWDSRSVLIGNSFYEVLKRGTFEESIRSNPVAVLVEHDPTKRIATTENGTLSIEEDERGLRVSIEPNPDVSYARDIISLVKRADVRGFSFGMKVQGQTWTRGGAYPLRTVTKALISEVSITSSPAYAATTIEARSMAQAVADLERWRSMRLRVEAAY